MLSDYYYMLSAVAIVLVILIIYFSEIEMIKVDKTGREYNASLFILAPLSIIALVITAVLSYQSWNIEVLYTDGVEVYTHITSMGYFTIIWFFLFIVICALLGKSIFEFFINAFYDPEGRWQR